MRSWPLPSGRPRSLKITSKVLFCVGWPGVKKRTFEPGEIFHLSYRVWIHDRPGELDALKAAYEAYQAGLKAEWK